MKTNLLKTIVFFAAVCAVETGALSAFAGGRAIEPIVSTDWLNANSDDVMILDVRHDADYQAGHIPDAVSAPFEIPFSIWLTMRDDLLLEVPDDVDLFASLGALGITVDSKIVVVSAPNPGEPPHYGLSGATRVAVTLIYAGVKNVAILDGGYPKWVDDGLEISTESATVTPTTFNGAANAKIFVNKEHVASMLRRASIVDNRGADVYFGATIEPYALKAGHIPGAHSLPTPWIWDDMGDDVYTYKDADLLKEMAEGVVHRQWWWGCREIIVYCGVGGYASSWWYVLTQVLGYKNVKFYDGSAQEWVTYYDMVPYKWE